MLISSTNSGTSSSLPFLLVIPEGDLLLQLQLSLPVFPTQPQTIGCPIHGAVSSRHGWECKTFPSQPFSSVIPEGQPSPVILPIMSPQSQPPDTSKQSTPRKTSLLSMTRKLLPLTLALTLITSCDPPKPTPKTTTHIT